jgi:hypothetical protein
MRQTGHRSPVMLEVVAREHAPLTGTPSPASACEPMTTTEPATETAVLRALSPRTRQTYGLDWALFTEWFAVTGHPELPADPGSVLQFLAACPAARATQRCRVAAIDHHHTTANLPRRGRRGGAGRPRPTDRRTSNIGNESPAVAAALRALPRHGWTHGMFGRRDRCLLVLSQLAGVPYQVLAMLTAGDGSFVGGMATINSAAGAWTLCPASGGALLGGPCAIARWLEVLDVAVTRIATGGCPVTEGRPRR